MGSIATVKEKYVEPILDSLKLEIPDKIKNKVKLSILLDNKPLLPDQKEDFPSDSEYVIAYDGTNVYHLCIGYIEDDGKKGTERVESLAKLEKRVKEQKKRQLSELNKEIESKEKEKESLQDEYNKILTNKRLLVRDMPDLEAAAKSFSERRNEAEKEYEKLVGKIERLRKKFLIRVLFHIYKLELE